MPEERDMAQPVCNVTSSERKAQVQMDSKLGQVPQVSTNVIQRPADAPLTEIPQIYQQWKNFEENRERNIPVTGGTRPAQRIPTQIQESGQRTVSSLWTPERDARALPAPMPQLWARMLADHQTNGGQAS